MKKCVSCKIDKKLTKFYRGEIAGHGLNNSCSECKNESRIRANARQAAYYQKNRDKVLQKQKLRDSIRAKPELSAEQRLARSRRVSAYNSKRKKRDPAFKLACAIRNRNYAVFKTSRSASNEKTLGVSYDQAVSYIESKFYEDKDGRKMSWKNHGHGPGKWQIDHVVPLGSANSPEEMSLLGNITNLQPLWHEDHANKTTRDIEKIKFNKINKIQTK